MYFNVIFNVFIGREGDVKQVCILLDKGSDVNYVDPSDGNTALHMASANGFAYLCY